MDSLNPPAVISLAQNADRPARAAHVELRPAAIDLTVHLILAQQSLDGDGHIAPYVASAGLGVHVHLDPLSQVYCHAAAGGPKGAVFFGLLGYGGADTAS